MSFRSGEMSERGPKNFRNFLFIPEIHHSPLEQIQYKTFFHLCRVEGISYDLEKKVGTAFVLIDSLQSGIIGLIGVGESYDIAL